MREKSAISLPCFFSLPPLKNRAAARWLYVVTAETGILGKPSMLLMNYTHHMHTCIHKYPQSLNLLGLCYTLYLVVCYVKGVCLNRVSPMSAAATIVMSLGMPVLNW